MKRYIKSNIVDVSDESPELKRSIAADPNTRPSVLAQLANDIDWAVKWKVAYNPNTPAEALVKLMTIPDTDIQVGVASNPNTPVEVLEENWDRCTDVACAIAKNPNTPEEVLDKMVGLYNKPIALSLMENPNLPQYTLFRLASKATGYASDIREPAMDLYKKKYLGAT